MQAYESILQDVPLFAALPPDEIAHLAGSLERFLVPAHTILFEENDTGAQCYIVLTGALEIVKARGTPDERILSVRGPGELVGEMSLFKPDHRRTASVRAQSVTELLEMTHDDFDALLHRHPRLAYEIVRMLSIRLGESGNATIRDLQLKNRQLEQALADLQAAQAQVIEKEKLERELEVAWRIQQSILPRTLPQVAGIDFDARIVPARTVGGDFFDFIPIGNDATGVVIGDVSGKGVPSAIFMALTRSLLRAEAERAATPEEALCNVNRHLLNMNDAGMFVTVLYGILDHRTNTFDYVRAGHELPVILDAGGTTLTPQFGNGQPLGILDDPVLDHQSVVIPPNGTLFLFTDGVTEAMNEAGAFFGHEQLVATLSGCEASDARSVCTSVIDAVLAHQGSALQYDDVTMVAIHAGCPATA
jgi:phosphoserine phosphatase RsbU/P